MVVDACLRMFSGCLVPRNQHLDAARNSALSSGAHAVTVSEGHPRNRYALTPWLPGQAAASFFAREAGMLVVGWWHLQAIGEISRHRRNARPQEARGIVVWR